MDEVTLVKKVSAETKNAIARKSAQTLPINPSERGYSAEEIKRRFWQPIIDTANSAISEIDRVVDEVNNAISKIDGNFDTYLTDSVIRQSYRKSLTKESWTYDEARQIYKIIVPASEHKIDNYKEIGVDMYLLDNDGNYVSVNQFEVTSSGDVVCVHEYPGVGHLSIYVKREGFILGASAVSVDNVIGLASVAKSNDYEDLDNKPDLSLLSENEEILSKIITGEQKVYLAENSNFAENANYASVSESSTNSQNSELAKKAEADAYGVNIANGYAKQNGNYPNMTVGNATNANIADCDEEGINIKSNYAKQSGSYPNLTVGKATNADNAANATNSSQAIADENGDNIVNTYAKQTGTYQNMAVGESTKATSIVLLTTPPSEAPPSGTLVIYQGASLPETVYDGVLYLITGEQDD